MAILLSFDIDGTLELGDPPGGVTVDMVRRAIDHGFIVGSCSDRPLSSQRRIWASLEIEPDFVVSKHQLAKVKEQFDDADAYYHMGDRNTDYEAAEDNGFGFWWHHEAELEPWLELTNSS